jgi:hypothetical protein
MEYLLTMISATSGSELTREASSIYTRVSHPASNAKFGGKRRTSLWVPERAYVELLDAIMMVEEGGEQGYSKV